MVFNFLGSNIHYTSCKINKCNIYFINLYLYFRNQNFTFKHTHFRKVQIHYYNSNTILLDNINNSILFKYIYPHLKYNHLNIFHILYHYMKNNFRFLQYNFIKLMKTLFNIQYRINYNHRDGSS